MRIRTYKGGDNSAKFFAGSSGYLKKGLTPITYRYLFLGTYIGKNAYCFVIRHCVTL